MIECRTVIPWYSIMFVPQIHKIVCGIVTAVYNTVYGFIIFCIFFLLYKFPNWRHSELPTL